MSLQRTSSSLCRLWKQHNKTFLLGQIISILVAGTGVFTTELSDRKVIIPTSQSFLNYVMLTGYLAYKLCVLRDTKFKAPWWRYLLCAIVDVEANYTVVLAYKYTTITSVMLLDCFTIPSTMLLSKIFLSYRYTWRNFTGVAICLVGLLILVISDVIAAKNSPQPGEASDRLWGDILCLIAAFLYAVSNVMQETMVKHYDRVEFLGMLGLFGVAVSGVQVAVVERQALASVTWTWPVVGSLAGFVFCLFSMYSLTSMFLCESDATLFNLSLLTSDVWAVLAAFLIFQTPPNGFYFLALGVIVVGLGMYHQDTPFAKSEAGEGGDAEAATGVNSHKSSSTTTPPPSSLDQPLLGVVGSSSMQANTGAAAAGEQYGTAV